MSIKTAEEDDDRCHIGSYRLTEEERLAVMALNEMRGVAHLVEEKNKETEEYMMSRRKGRADKKIR